MGEYGEKRTEAISISWKPDRQSKIPLYSQIVSYFSEKISSGDWVSGQVLPSQRKLSELFEVNRSTIVEAMDKLLAVNGPLCHANSEMLEALVPFKGVQIKCGSTVKSAQPGNVVIAGKDGEESIPADSVILCVGYKSENGLYDQLKDSVDAIYQIGDANKVANIMYAIWDAYEVASTL